MCAQTRTAEAETDDSIGQGRSAEGGPRVQAAAGVRRRHVNHRYPVNNKDEASPKCSAR